MKIRKQALQEARERKLADIIVQMCVLDAVLVLNGEFGFGKERLTRFADEFAKTMTDYRNRYDEVALEALVKHAREKGIELEWV